MFRALSLARSLVGLHVLVVAVVVQFSGRGVVQVFPPRLFFDAVDMQ